MGICYYNAERYADPTAFAALSNIIRAEKAAKRSIRPSYHAKKKNPHRRHRNNRPGAGPIERRPSI